MKKVCILLGTAALCLHLSGCSLAAFLLSGGGCADPDLVVVNHSGQAVYAITLDRGEESCTVQSARGDALLERGESYGVCLEEDRTTVTLSDARGRTLASLPVVFQGERLCLTLEEGGRAQLEAVSPNRHTSRSTQAP